MPSATLDPTFGSGGIVTTAVGGGWSSHALGDLLQPNGDVIAYGQVGNQVGLALTRYTPSGSLDPTFGTGGIVSNTTMSHVTQAALQPDGKIVVVGRSQVVRYNSNGALDATFGSNGVVTPPSNFSADTLLIQPGNGDIVVGGSSGSDSALLQYTPNGALDPTFGSGGKVVTPGGVRFNTLALENGEILAGSGNLGVGYLARYTLNGSLDTTFGSGGIATTPGDVSSLLVQPNGQIVAVGSEAGGLGGREWALARYNVDGSLDTTFGSGGVVTSNIGGNDRAFGSALGSNGLIAVVGVSYNTSLAEVGVYNPNGSPDANFGSGGFATAWFSSPPSEYGGGVVIQPDGKMVVAATSTVNIELARYLPVAQTSPSFTITGPTTVTAGTAGTITLTTLNPDGTLDTGYTGTVHFTSSDPQAVLPTDYTFTTADQGVHTFNTTLDTAGSQSLTATDATAGIIGSETGITVNPAAASTLAVSGFPTPNNVAIAGGFTVTAFDPYGNKATGYAGAVHFTSSDPLATLPADYIFRSADNGAHAFSATFGTAGTQSLTATDTATGSITGAQTGIISNPASAPAASFSVTGFPSSPTAGVAGTVTVTARDASGNVAGSYRGTVHFTSSDSLAGLPADYTFTAADQGVHTFTVTLKKAGTQSLTATDTATGSITGSETGIAVKPAAASQFILSAPSSVTKGSAFSVTLTVEDAFGNVVTGYTGKVHFASSDGTATLPTDYTFTAGDAGVHTFVNKTTLRKRGTKTLSVTDTANSALTTTDSINVV